MFRAICAAALITAFAGEGRADDAVTLGRAGTERVYVWTDHEAYKEGVALIRAKVHETNPALIMRLMACVAKAGDRAVITDAGMFSHTIIVIDGDAAGCRGFIAMEDIR